MLITALIQRRSADGSGSKPKTFQRKSTEASWSSNEEACYLVPYPRPLPSRANFPSVTLYIHSFNLLSIWLPPPPLPECHLPEGRDCCLFGSPPTPRTGPATTWNTERHCTTLLGLPLTVPQAGKLKRSKCIFSQLCRLDVSGQGGILLRSLSFVCRWPSLPVSPSGRPSVCVCFLISSSYKVTSYTGLGPTLGTSFLP